MLSVADANCRLCWVSNICPYAECRYDEGHGAQKTVKASRKLLRLAEYYKKHYKKSY